MTDFRHRAHLDRPIDLHIFRPPFLPFDTMTITVESSDAVSPYRANNTWALEDRFEILKEDIGDGSFGSVALARVRTAGAHLARRGTMVGLHLRRRPVDGLHLPLTHRAR